MAHVYQANYTWLSLQETELWKACRDGDIRTAQEAVDNNVNVNWENSQEHVSKTITDMHDETSTIIAGLLV